MSTLVIYGIYCEGYVLKGSMELKPLEPCSAVCNVKEAYASINVDITGGVPVVVELNEAGFAPGFEVDGVTYVHFKSGHVPDEILIREA